MAVVVDDEVVADFAVVDGGGRAVDLESRIATAVDRAGEELGIEVVEVRVICIDDGGSGRQIGRIGNRLVDAGVRFEVLDLVAPGVGPGCDVLPAERSAARARSAALW